MPFVLTTEELRSFYATDRALFRRLIVNLGLDPYQMMKIIALWIWLEALGFPSIIETLQVVPDIVLYAIVEEGLTCLYFIEYEDPPQVIHENIQLMQNILKQPISLGYLHDKRIRGRTVISRTVNEMFMRAFEDIVLEANGMQLARSSWNTNSNVQATVDGRILIVENGLTQNVIMPDHVGWTQFGSRAAHPLMPLQEEFKPNANVRDNFHIGESSNRSARHRNSFGNVAPTNRTLSLTFQRGHAVTAEELRDFFFANNFGNMIEAILIDETVPGSQAISARVVMRSAADVHQVLCGLHVVKVVIGGKDVWIKGF